MKKILGLILLLAIAIPGITQNDRYSTYMKRTMAQLDSAKTPDDLQNVANSFERIAGSEKDKWLPYYYAGYATVLKSFNTEDKSKVDGICDKADELVAMAESLSPKNSEITTLKAMILQSRLSVDPSRGQTMGLQSGNLLRQALSEKPENNPRALTQLAQTTYYTPSAFGGGKAPGIEMLKKAISSYDSFKPENELYPNWGEDYAKQLLEQWNK